MEELLHVSFVKDGREVPEELSAEEDAENNVMDQSIYDLRKEYWTYALPIEWEKIAHFHAEMTKQLADYVFYPYQHEILELNELL